MAIEGFECPRLRGALGSQSSKERDMSDPVIWRKKWRGMAGEPGVKQVKGTKEIETSTMARRSLSPQQGDRIGWYHQEVVSRIP